MRLNLATGDLNLLDSFINVRYSPTDNFFVGGKGRARRKRKLKSLYWQLHEVTPEDQLDLYCTCKQHFYVQVPIIRWAIQLTRTQAAGHTRVQCMGLVQGPALLPTEGLGPSAADPASCAAQLQVDLT